MARTTTPLVEFTGGHTPAADGADTVAAFRMIGQGSAQLTVTLSG